MVITLQLDDQRIVTIGCHCISISKEIEKQRSHFQSNDVVKAYYVPLLLSHAITVHRLQGSTIRRQLFYMPRSFGYYCREFYVIATRVTSLDYLYLINLPQNLRGVVDPVEIEMYHKLFQTKKKRIG